MPHYYLTSFVGTGTDANPFRARGMDVGATMIDLRPNGANQAGFALLALPVQTSIPSARYLGDDLLGALPLAVRQGLATDLGITLDALTFRQAVLELLSQHARTDGTRWKPLRPGRDGMWRVYLGGLLWEAPDISGGASYSDNFDVADNAALSGQLTWTEFHNTGWQTAGNAALISGNVGTAGARADHAHGTDDHWAQVDLTAFTRGGGTIQGGPLVRKAGGDNTVTYYVFVAHRTASANEHQLNKLVANTSTTLQTVADDVATPSVLKVQADGSTITGYIGGVQVASQTDTEIVDNLHAGIRAQSNNSGNALEVDNYASADVVVVTVGENNYQRQMRGAFRGTLRGGR